MNAIVRLMASPDVQRGRIMFWPLSRQGGGWLASWEEAEPLPGRCEVW